MQEIYCVTDDSCGCPVRPGKETGITFEEAKKLAYGSPKDCTIWIRDNLKWQVHKRISITNYVQSGRLE